MVAVIEGEVGLFDFLTKPRVPVQALRRFSHVLVQRPLRPDRAIGPEANFFQSADSALLDPFLDFPLAVHRTTLITHLGDQSSGLGSFVKAPDFANVITHWLLDSHVLFMANSPHGGWEVGVVRCRDNHGVDPRVLGVEHLAEVGIKFGVDFGVAFTICVKALQSLCSTLSAIHIGIDQGDDVMKIRHIVGIGLALTHGSDGRNVELFIGSKHVAWEDGGHGQSGGQHRGIADKRTTIDGRIHGLDRNPFAMTLRMGMQVGRGEVHSDA